MPTLDAGSAATVLLRCDAVPVLNIGVRASGPFARRCKLVKPMWKQLLLLVLLPTMTAIAQDDPPSCMTPAYRQFDFWLGDWNVYRPDGRLAGTNRVTSEFGGCVLQEHYENASGYSGSSFNIYDAGRKRWHQTWVDTSGLLLELDGGLVDGSMVLAGETVGADGTVTRHRITWTPNADGTVRQLWESRAESDDAESDEWTVTFDGLYTRAAEPD